MVPLSIFSTRVCLVRTSFVFVFLISPLLDHTLSSSESNVSAVSLRMHFTNPEEKAQSVDGPEINRYAAPRFAACPYLLSKWCCRRVELASTVRHSPPPQNPEYTYRPNQVEPFVWPMHLYVILVFNRRFICPLPNKLNDQAANIADPRGNFFPPPRHLASLPPRSCQQFYIESNVYVMYIEERQSLQIYRNYLYPNTRRAGLPSRLLKPFS